MIEKVEAFKIGSVPVGGNRPLIVIAGLCVIESEEHTVRIAAALKEISREQKIPLIFKASYDKANRTALSSYRGPGIAAGLKILERVKRELDLPLLVDFHRETDAAEVARVADVLQVPAFLCRQTDMLLAAARTGRAVNVKKGQFLAPGDARYIIDKVVSGGNRRLLITERGVSFGYHNLINDMRALPIMRRFGFPVIFDATHSVQAPGGGEGYTGGDREFIPFLARAAAAAGCDGIFMEVHDRPEKARSDTASVLPLDDLPELLRMIGEIDRLVKRNES